VPALAAYGDVPDLSVALRLRALHGLIWWAIFAEADPKHRVILDERLARAAAPLAGAAPPRCRR
jgi:hypothetical protein